MRDLRLVCAICNKNATFEGNTYKDITMKIDKTKWIDRGNSDDGRIITCPACRKKQERGGEYPSRQ